VACGKKGKENFYKSRAHPLGRAYPGRRGLSKGKSYPWLRP